MAQAFDVPAYILDATKEIWEDRRISSLTRHYAPGIIVRSPASVVVGNKGVIAATMATLHEFPDRELFGEDVIWCATQAGNALSSHRLICTATHAADGIYGAATGARLTYRILADCHVADGRIDDEWLVRDQSAIAAQLGMSAEDYARALIDKEGGPEACVQPYTPANDVAGPYDGRGNEEAWGARLTEMLTRIMAGELSVIADAYDRAALLAYPGGEEALSFAGADAFWLGLRAAFPSAAFAVEHVIGRSDPDMPPRAAIRWSLAGRHDGWGRFGRPTGAEVHVMGITHVEYGAVVAGQPRIRREWTLIDETAVWKQILLATGRM
ncbi:MAG: ester cyclase [Pseudomonadota bacterium]